MSTFYIAAGHAVDVPSGGSYGPGERFEHSGHGLAALIDAGLIGEIEEPKKEKTK